MEANRAAMSPSGFLVAYNAAETDIEHCRVEARLAVMRFASYKDHYVNFEERKSSVSE